MNTNEAIILAGGQGTRLRKAVPDLPKPLAPIKGHPFLRYLLQELQQQGVRRIVLSTGYKKADLRQFIDQSHFPELQILFAEEEEPLGTGGALKFASQQIQGARFFAINGDTLFRASLKQQEACHITNQAAITLALKPMNDPSRYGVVEHEKGRITHFVEKGQNSPGLINGGIYLIEKHLLAGQQKRFSFEKDFLEKQIHTLPLYATIQDHYFIDIGLPETWQQAQEELPKAFPALF
ncbi:nucleotidyltransferase family protein [Magnetococcales bacterium HHB-1]